MTINEWAAKAGRAEGERNSLLDVIRMAVEALQGRDYPSDPGFARIILESILLAMDERAANDNTAATQPKARA